jgi:hypothetical protein
MKFRDPIAGWKLLRFDINKATEQIHTTRWNATNLAIHGANLHIFT